MYGDERCVSIWKCDVRCAGVSGCICVCVYMCVRACVRERKSSVWRCMVV